MIWIKNSLLRTLRLVSFVFMATQLPYSLEENAVQQETSSMAINQTSSYPPQSNSSTTTTATTATTTTSSFSRPIETSTTAIVASTTLPPVSHISSVRNYNWVVALIVLASVGILAVIGLELYIQFKIYGSPLTGDCSSQWLGHVLLFGIFLSYLLMYAFIPYPCQTTCGIIRFCVGVCYSLCFGAIVVKLAVILSPTEVHPVLALILFLFIWIVQIVIDIQWLIHDPPEVIRFDNTDGFVCHPGFAEHVKSLVYVMTLIVCSLCACAVATCKAGSSSSSDIVSIGLSCAFTVAVWIVWILLGYLKVDTEYHDPCLAFGLLVTVSVILVFVFVPKIRQLNRIEEFSFEGADDDVIKPEAIAYGTKRSRGGSNDDISWNGGGGYGWDKGRDWNSRKMATLVEDEESHDQMVDPYALHVQYPTKDTQPNFTRWGSINSADGYNNRLKGPPSSSSRTSEPARPSSLNHVSHKVNGNSSHVHPKVNHHDPRPRYSYSVSSSLQSNRSAVVGHNHKQRQKQNRY